jgi:hypothetical protein
MIRPISSGNAFICSQISLGGALRFAEPQGRGDNVPPQPEPVARPKRAEARQKPRAAGAPLPPRNSRRYAR